MHMYTKGCLLTVVTAVLMFLVSNTPRLVLNLTEYSVHSGDPSAPGGCGCDTTPTWFTVTISVNHFLLTINSSINFLIYCSVGDKFKAVVRKILLKTGEGSSVSQPKYIILLEMHCPVLHVIFYEKEHSLTPYSLSVEQEVSWVLKILLKVTILSSNIEVLILDCHKTKTILHMTLMFGTSVLDSSRCF